MGTNEESRLGGDARARLARHRPRTVADPVALFDDVAEEEFERLPAMAECAGRRRLDDGLSEILGLPNLDGLRRPLASEPVVSNRRL